MIPVAVVAVAVVVVSMIPSKQQTQHVIEYRLRMLPIFGNRIFASVINCKQIEEQWKNAYVCKHRYVYRFEQRQIQQNSSSTTRSILCFG